MRVRVTEWTVESSDGTSTKTTRAVDAFRKYQAGGKRLLRNGRPLRMTDDDPTLFEETT